jgi:HPt (histidine-containing phosphotransfer) domain-containing protein
MPISSIFDYAGSLRRMGNDPALFREMALLLGEDAPQYLSAIRDAIDQGDYPSLKRAAHTLKGLVLNFGATRAIAAAVALELIAESAASGHSTEQMNLPSATDELEAALQELLKALERPQTAASHQPSAVHKR